MNGADILIRTLIASGIDTCFTNPGTSEMHIVGALDRTDGIRCVLGLFEGVVTGAADGYARMADKPACTLLHLGPGLANGLANLHNASRAHVPMINIVGQHATDHLQYDTPLKSDIEAIARPYSKWLRTACGADRISHDAAEAIAAANTSPGQIATLIVPANVAWSDVSLANSSIVEASAVLRAPMPDSEKIEQAAVMLQSRLRTAVLLADKGLYGRGLEAAGRIAAASNAKLLAPYPFTRMRRGLGLPVVDRMHYVLEQAIEQLKEFHHLILVGSQAPISYFAYPGKSSVITPAGCVVHTLSSANEDCVGALETLVGLLPGRKIPVAAECERPFCQKMRL
jgi:acetolactate synthase-1/2/3 large subunit